MVALKPAAHVRICGIPVPIYVGTAKDNASLEGAWGCYEPERLEIWLAEDTPKALVEEVLSHEVLHALIYRSGLIYEMCAVFGLTRADPRIDAWEEAMVRRLTPHIVESLEVRMVNEDKPKKRAGQKAKAANAQRRRPGYSRH